jgi:nucleoside-diphosphate-sugar epimerase
MTFSEARMPETGGRLLVTGASGFIGACLVRRLVAAGRAVHVLLRPGPPPPRLAGLESQYVTHHADLRDADAVRSAVESCQPETVYHLAAHGTRSGQLGRTAIFASNLLGTAHLLDALDGYDYRAFVHAGSSSEYGPVDRPMREDDPPRPRTDYGVAKAAATLLCQAEAYRGRPVVTVRIFSAYGPFEEPNRLASSVMAACLRGDLPRVTQGHQPRDWIYVDDVLDLLETTAAAPRVEGAILHAGTGRRQSVRDLVEAVIAACPVGHRMPIYGAYPDRPDEPAVWVADVARTSLLTGWTPRVGLAEGARRMWQWFINGHRAVA